MPQNKQPKLVRISEKLQQNMQYVDELMGLETNFDIIHRVIRLGDTDACMYLIDGFCKDELMQKILQYLMDLKAEDFPKDAHEMSKIAIPYVEVDLDDTWEKILGALLSGVFVLLLDGYEKAVLIDARTYPTRGVEEPDKDKVLRGSKDGFVETVVFNTALIRRRIRSTDLHMEMLNAGENSRTDIVLCYMESRVDPKLLTQIRERIRSIQVDALAMNQESLAECLYQRKWYNPFPKFKYTERPDTAAACILEGNIVILVDNSPAAMVLPSSVFDIIEEADDYYFPPVTGTYLRLSRMMTGVLCLLLTPTWLLGMMHADALPQWLAFTKLSDRTYVPLIFQLLILEFAIDGLRLAAINTPSMLTTPLSVIAGIVLGEYSVKSGWFNSETMLYMAFVTIANYSQSSFELGYALKFMRVILLLLTAVFDVWGYITGFVIAVCAIVFNKTIAGKSYIYPIIPFSWKEVKKRFFRGRLPVIPESQNAKQ